MKESSPKSRTTLAVTCQFQSQNSENIIWERSENAENVALNMGWHIFGWDLLKSIKLCLSPHLSFWLHCISHHHVYYYSLQQNKCKSFRWFFAPFHEVMSFPNNYSLYLLAAWLIQLWKWTKHIVKPCYILIHTEWGTVQSANSSLSTACATFSPGTLQMILPLITVTVIWYLVYLSTWLVHLVQHVSCNGPSGSAMWSAL